jgi:hypothetical protein
MPGTVFVDEGKAFVSVYRRNVKNNGCVGLSTGHTVDWGSGSSIWSPWAE